MEAVVKHIRAVAPPPIFAQPIPGFKSKTYAASVVRIGIKREKLRKQGGRCLYCTQPLTVRQATVEHRKPIGRGGTDTACNIDAACKPCNTAKGWLTKREFNLAIFNPNLQRDGWEVYLACIEIRLKRRAEQACTRLWKAIAPRAA